MGWSCLMVLQWNTCKPCVLGIVLGINIHFWWSTVCDNTMRWSSQLELGWFWKEPLVSTRRFDHFALNYTNSFRDYHCMMYYRKPNYYIIVFPPCNWVSNLTIENVHLVCGIQPVGWYLHGICTAVIDGELN